MSREDERATQEARVLVKTAGRVTVTCADGGNKILSIEGKGRGLIVRCTTAVAIEIVAGSGFVRMRNASEQLMSHVDGSLVYTRPRGTAMYHPPIGH